MDATRQLPDLMSIDRNKRISQVVRDMGQQLMRFIRARVRTEADAEDVSQEVWQQLSATLEEGPIQQVGAWLFTVARHRIIDRYRKPPMASLEAMAAEMEEAADFDFAGFFLREDRTPRTEHLRQLFWEELSAALAELPAEQRQVFMWHEFDGMSFRDIAALTGENVNTLLARKRYAVLRLRERLEPLRADFLSTAKH